MTEQSTSEPKAINFVFPFRDVRGKDIVDEHVFYDWLTNEDTGNFAVSSTGMWHGGIHVSAEGAGQHLDLPHGVRGLADGWIVAYLMNRLPLASQIAAGGGKSAQTGHYSSAFTLVRHTLEFPANNTLTFFSLYMHLQSVAEYKQNGWKQPAYWARSYKVAKEANDKPKSDARHGEPTPEQVGLNIHTKPGDRDILGILPRGAQVHIGERSRDKKWGKLTAIESGGLIPPRVNGAVRPGAETGWVYLDKERGHYLLTEDVSETQCDQIIVPKEPIKIAAGDLIGHLGQYWQPAEPSREHRMVHIEVFCDDTLPQFLKECAKAGEKISEFDKLSLLRIERGTKLFKGHSVDEEGAHAPVTGLDQIYSQAALDALPADCKGPVDNDPLNHGKGEPWWYITCADSRYKDISGWVRNRQTPAGRVTRESPYAWPDFETVTGADAGNPTIFSTVDAWLDHVLCEDKPATSDVSKLKPLACGVYRQLSPMRDEAKAADELRTHMQNKWLRFRASRLIPKHRSEWASQSEYQSFFEKVLQRVTKEPYHDAEIERIKRLVWWDEVQQKLKKAKQPFPARPDVFHIHPIALVGNFRQNCDCATKFKKISAIILRHEGGYVNQASDKGGPTNHGIAWNTWQAYAQEDLNVEPTLDNLKQLTSEQAETIYLKRYWEPKGFCKFNDQRVALMVYDWTITSSGAAKQIQSMLNSRYDANIEIDGGMGNKTVEALNSIDNQEKLLNEIANLRRDYYTNITINNPSQIVYLKGWLKRVDDCLQVEI
jgi:lysozyme family protein